MTHFVYNLLKPHLSNTTSGSILTTLKINVCFQIFKFSPYYILILFNKASQRIFSHFAQSNITIRSALDTVIIKTHHIQRVSLRFCAQLTSESYTRATDSRDYIDYKGARDRVYIFLHRSERIGGRIGASQQEITRQ